ncbi:Hpt domain-containing protein [Lignipirellula cremea]|uniref:Hybrid sensory histidine kinase BarA n=1 Tax=Lignipirellula cremea TaxID=2528010 RepID=A0A518DZJ0_9BACT|nr:Hpt domain-containing protein [Lignipirellula cremea]QDU97231.1 hybrid sensory histidine kinase BarA [Lignipirellula cremea]
MNDLDSCEPLYSLIGENPDFSDLVDLYVERMPLRIADIERAVSDENRSALETFVHQLKGSAGGYGFPRISELAAIVEDQLRSDEDIQQILAVLNDVICLCRRVRAGGPSQNAL